MKVIAIDFSDSDRWDGPRLWEAADGEDGGDQKTAQYRSAGWICL